MSTKSPGIYFTENDYTQFSNPKAVQGTTVAIVGFAEKGPINEPVLISNWADFVKVFGKAVAGYYSALAVKNVLAAGGYVLFNRVADSTTSQSNYIVKNNVEAVNGKTVFAKSGDVLIGTNKYNNGYIYTMKAFAGETSKVLFVRSPASGKLTQTSILKQISEQLPATNGTFEKVVKSTADGFFGFNVKMDDEIVGLNHNGFYLETKEKWTPATLASALVSCVSSGANATYVMSLDTTYTGGSVNYLEPTDILGISGTKKFTVKINSASYKVSVNIPETTTLKDLAEILDTSLKNAYGIRVILDEGKNEISDVVQPKLIFVLKSKGAGNSIEISQAETNIGASLIYENNEIVGCSELFCKCSDGNADEFQPAVSEDGTTEIYNYSVKVFESKKTINTEGLYNDFTISSNDDTGSVIFKNNKTGAASNIELTNEGIFGNYILEQILGEEIGRIDGQEALNLSVYRDSQTKQIALQSNSGIESPKFSNIVSSDINLAQMPTIFQNLLEIMNTTQIEEGYQEIPGNSAVDASTQDMVIFTAKTFGVVDNIAVECYTSASPIDGKIKHDITVKVDGSLVETFEDVSLDYQDAEKRFDTLINTDAENGGSAYITCDVIKNNFEVSDVQLPDGVYYIGRANKAEDVKKDQDVAATSYNLYDYILGCDGVPKDDGAELFCEAMKEDVSALANTDLYDFHVLITPDNICQEVQSAAISLCENRGDAIAIIDPPVGLDKEAVIKWHNGRGYGRSEAPQSNYAAVYWPWCKVYDNSTKEGRYTWVMPSVVMASKYVSVDKSVGAHYAPAGETNGVISVIDIETSPNKIDRDDLYLDYNRINPFVKFKDGSIVCYGEKTLARINSVLTKIHTRRMLIQIKKSCREALKGYIFMPNSTEYLSTINGHVTAILEKYKANGGLAAYSVICDESNNTTETRQQDIVNVSVALVPNGTIEQINIDLNLYKSQESISVAEK